MARMSYVQSAQIAACVGYAAPIWLAPRVIPSLAGTLGYTQSGWHTGLSPVWFAPRDIRSLACTQDYPQSG